MEQREGGRDRRIDMRAAALEAPEAKRRRLEIPVEARLQPGPKPGRREEVCNRHRLEFGAGWKPVAFDSHNPRRIVGRSTP